MWCQASWIKSIRMKGPKVLPKTQRVQPLAPHRQTTLWEHSVVKPYRTAAQSLVKTASMGPLSTTLLPHHTKYACKTHWCAHQLLLSAPSWGFGGGLVL